MSTLTAAAACAAWLMGTTPVLPDEYRAEPPSGDLCRYASRDLPTAGLACRGVFLAFPDGRTTIVAIDHFGVLTHELCHAIQHAEGRPVEESECYAVQDRTPDCFRGAGAPGMW